MFSGIKKAMKEYPPANLLLTSFQTTLKRGGVWEQAISQPKFHKPGVHSLPLVLSMEYAVRAAYHLESKTGIKVVLPVAVCDVGKANQFIQYCQAEHHEGHYRGSALTAAKLAYTAGVASPEDLLLIFQSRLGSSVPEQMIQDLFHNSRPNRVRELLDLPKDQELDVDTKDNVLWLTMLLGVLGCRALSRGWTPQSEKERPRLATRVKTLGDKYSLDPAFCEILIKDVILNRRHK